MSGSPFHYKIKTFAKFSPQNFNDFLCIFILAAIFLLWLLAGLEVLNLNPEILGATITFFTIIGQFYFRKSQNEK
jgi:hypothetical protein